MTSRLGIAVAICLCMAGGAAAQVVRFETTMGNFDMVLNPTNNPLIQNHVDNMLQYVDRETYNGTWINRGGPSGFVLQMGGFYSQTQLPQFSIEQVRNIRGLSPIEGHPAGSNPPLSNTVGTVSLALSGNPANPNSGSNSFFVNLTDNSFLDPQFTVFAAISNMSVVNEIMALETMDQTANPNFPDQAGNLGLSDIPVQQDGNLVFIKRVFVVSDNLEVARANASVQSVMAASSQAFADSANAMLQSSAATAASPGLSPIVVPEPGTLSLLAGLLSGLGFAWRRRRA